MPIFSNATMHTTTGLRQLLAEPRMLTVPGAHDGLTARLIGQAGFPALNMTGAGTPTARIAFAESAQALAEVQGIPRELVGRATLPRPWQVSMARRGRFDQGGAARGLVEIP